MLLWCTHFHLLIGLVYCFVSAGSRRVSSDGQEALNARVDEIFQKELHSSASGQESAKNAAKLMAAAVHEAMEEELTNAIVGVTLKALKKKRLEDSPTSDEDVKDEDLEQCVNQCAVDNPIMLSNANATESKTINETHDGLGSITDVFDHVGSVKAIKEYVEVMLRSGRRREWPNCRRRRRTAKCVTEEAGNECGRRRISAMVKQMAESPGTWFKSSATALPSRLGSGPGTRALGGSNGNGAAITNGNESNASKASTDQYRRILENQIANLGGDHTLRDIAISARAVGSANVSSMVQERVMSMGLHTLQGLTKKMKLCWPWDCLKQAYETVKEGLSRAWDTVKDLKDKIVQQAKDWAKQIADFAKETATKLSNAVKAVGQAIFKQLKSWYNTAVDALRAPIRLLIDPVSKFFTAVKDFGNHVVQVPENMIGMFTVVGEIFGDLEVMGGLYTKSIRTFQEKLGDNAWDLPNLMRPQFETAQSMYGTLRDLMEKFAVLAQYAKFIFELFEKLVKVVTTFGELFIALIRIVLSGLARITDTVASTGASLIEASTVWKSTFSGQGQIMEEIECLQGLFLPIAEQCIVKSAANCEVTLNAFDLDDIFDGLQRADALFKTLTVKLTAFKDWLLDGFNTYVKPVIEWIGNAISDTLSEIGKWFGNIGNEIVNFFKNIFNSFSLGGSLVEQKHITHLQLSIHADVKSIVYEALHQDHHHLVEINGTVSDHHVPTLRLPTAVGS